MFWFMAASKQTCKMDKPVKREDNLKNDFSNVAVEAPLRRGSKTQQRFEILERDCLGEICERWRVGGRGREERDKCVNVEAWRGLVFGHIRYDALADCFYCIETLRQGLNSFSVTGWLFHCCCEQSSVKFVELLFICLLSTHSHENTTKVVRFRNVIERTRFSS